MDEIPSDLPGTITWFKRVPPSKVAMFEVVGWLVEPIVPSHHDAHCVMMRYGGTVAAGAEPPIPIGRPRVVAKHHPAPMRRWGGPLRRCLAAAPRTGTLRPEGALPALRRPDPSRV